MTTEVFGTPGQNTWTCPAGVNTVQVELWGAGAGGGGNNTTSDGGGGGGSGGYARLNTYNVTPGNIYTYNVGTGSPGASGTSNAGNGGDTWWISAATFQAPGGLGGHGAFNASPRVGGAGGTTFVGTFDATRNGASGGSGFNGNVGVGGGGAGAADTDQAANAGAAGTSGGPGAGGAGTTQGGGGGAGGAAGAAGNAFSSAPGAGGGGSGDGGTRTGGVGSAGQVTLVHFVAADVPNSKRKIINSVVLAAWAIAPILLWQNGFTIPETSAPPPINREWVKIVNRSWQPPDPPPTQGRRFFPHESPAVEQTPYARPWLDTALRAWEPEARLAQRRAVQPPPTPDDIVFGRRPIPAAVLQAWAEPTWEAQRAPLFRPATPDDPPFSSRRPPQGWEPDTWDAQRAQHTPQEFVAADQAPYSRAWQSIIAQWTGDEWTAPPQRHVVPEQAAAVNDPIPGYRPWLKTALASWEQSPLIIWQNGILAQSGVDQVSYDRAWLYNVAAAWEPPAYTIPRPRAVAQEPPAQVDNPPERSRLQEAIRQAWQPDDWAAQRAPTFPEGVAAPEEKTPFPRRWTQALEHWEQNLVPLWGGFGVQPETFEPSRRQWLYTVARSWEVTWGAQTTRHVVQQGPVFDNPPVTERVWLRTVEQWQAPSWDAQSAKHTPPPTPDAPPVTERVWLETVLRAWEPVPNEAQRRPPQVQFTAAAVNDPPFGQRLWFPTVLASWEPPPPGPVQLTPTVTESGPEITPAPTAQQPAGKRLRARRWVLGVNGRDVVFDSLESLFAFLSTQEHAIAREAVTKAERDARRILRTGRAVGRGVPPEVRITTPVAEARDYIEEIEQRVERAYRNALASALSRDAEEIEDIKDITKLL